MARRHLVSVLGGFLAVLGLGTLLPAADLVFARAKETTKEFTGKNASALIGVSSIVPEELQIEVIEIIQGLQLSRDRILIVLDRIEEGLFPSKEGVKRIRAIAARTAQREKEFLQALIERVPAPVVPKVHEALRVSTQSWKRVLSSFRLPERGENPELPSRPGIDMLLGPALPRSPSSSE